MKTIKEWYEANNADHCHCGCGCDHPQPFIENGEAWCGRCWFVGNEKRRVDPCDGTRCEDYV